MLEMLFLIYSCMVMSFFYSSQRKSVWVIMIIGLFEMSPDKLRYTETPICNLKGVKKRLLFACREF